MKTLKNNVKICIKNIFIWTIRGYQLTGSVVFPNRCRFMPSCSEFTKEAIQKRGVLKGLSSGVRRILKCHPYHTGGWDPAP